MDGVLEELDYPVGREAAAEALDRSTVAHGNTTVDLGEVVSMVGKDEFEDQDAPRDEIHSYLPPEND